MSKDPEKIRSEIENLKDKILEHEYHYYIQDNPKISDTEFDILLKKLQKLESEYPNFAAKDSPSQRVGGRPREGVKTIRHLLPMLSLDNTYSIDELKEWEARNAKILPGKIFEYVVEPKIDGVSCAVIYENGVLSAGLTRGDGQTGEDVTANIKTIHTIPLKLKISAKNEIPEIIEVRGEIYMDKNDFIELNEYRNKKGIDIFANPRNAASGSLKLLDPAETASRKLKFRPHSFGRYTGKTQINAHDKFYRFLAAAGFKVMESYKLCAGIEEAVSRCLDTEKERDNFNYEIDGMVVKINDYSQRKVLGETSKSPRWAVAYKFAARQATTVVERVVFQVGRTGAVTPVALLQPVECGGVTISRATLHNFDEVKRLGVSEGDTVLIERAGDVIPKVVKVTRKAEGSEAILPPEHCPECGSKIIKQSDEDVAYICPNPLCPAQVVRAIIHFGSRTAMDIDGLGESAVEQLVWKGFLKSVADIYSLTREKLLRLDLFKYKKADKLLEAIEKSKTADLARFIYALGIRNVGEKASRLIAAHFKSLQNIMNAAVDDLTAIDEVGPVIARSVADFFGNSGNSDIIDRLMASGVKPSAAADSGKTGSLSNKKFVFTGELKSMSRPEAVKKVELLGGEAVLTVSAKTDYVVAGQNPGSKYDKALKLELKILNEDEFLKLIG